jgi:hypothetical protein
VSNYICAPNNGDFRTFQKGCTATLISKSDFFKYSCDLGKKLALLTGLHSPMTTLAESLAKTRILQSREIEEALNSVKVEVAKLAELTLKKLT